MTTKHEAREALNALAGEWPTLAGIVSSYIDQLEAKVEVGLGATSQPLFEDMRFCSHVDERAL